MDTAEYSDTKYWVAFIRIPSIGTARVRLLERAFGTLEEAWQAPTEALRAAGMDRRALEQVVSRRPRIDPDMEMAQLDAQGIRAISWHHPEYPPLLKEIHDPPPVLFLKGGFIPEDRRAVAVVGTRRATAYGREACVALVQDLARNGVTIVSGLARGIDGFAHRAALEAGGRTIAVLASGLDVVYPPEHRDLAQEVAQAGALTSEHPLGTRPVAQNFPRRNRILSGMALGVLVVEAPDKSGAMWTVTWALEQGREVFAVPGSIFSPASQGVNRMVQDGAKLVLNYTDVLEDLNVSTMGYPSEYQEELPGLAPAPSLEKPEAELLSLIGYEPVHIDDVRRRAGLPMAVVSSTLAMLEIHGMVNQVGAMHYTRTREAPASYQPVT